MGYGCHLCNDAEPAAILITPLSGGDTLAIGQGCMVTGYCGLLSVLMGVDAQQLYDGLTALQTATRDAEAAAVEAERAKAARKPRAPRKPAPGPAPDTVPDSQQATA